MAFRLLEVNLGGNYCFLKTAIAARGVWRMAVQDPVVRLHGKPRRIHSAPEIARELPRLGVAAHRDPVSRIMQEHGKSSKSVGKWRPTPPQSVQGLGASPNLIGRDFAVSSPNQKWLRDITYVLADEGFPYLAGVMDAWDRSMVGWSMSDSVRASVALGALRVEVARRKPPRGLVHHSDRGVQYARRECRELLEECGIEQSISQSGNRYDNALMESL